MKDAQPCPTCAAITEPYGSGPRMRSSGPGGEQGQMPAEQPSHSNHFGLHLCSAEHGFRGAVDPPESSDANPQLDVKTRYRYSRIRKACRPPTAGFPCALSVINDAWAATGLVAAVKSKRLGFPVPWGTGTFPWEAPPNPSRPVSARRAAWGQPLPGKRHTTS